MTRPGDPNQHDAEASDKVKRLRDLHRSVRDHRLQREELRAAQAFELAALTTQAAREEKTKQIELGMDRSSKRRGVFPLVSEPLNISSANLESRPAAIRHRRNKLFNEEERGEVKILG